jgi:hypothetical protein
MSRWTVWVGGSEVTDYEVSKATAQELAQQFIDADYDDVRIEEV